jgi:glycosyltransferase involved in cell wall biosynthesis
VNALHPGNPRSVLEITPLAAPPLRVCHIVSGDLWAGAEVQASIAIKELAKRPDVQACAILLNEGRLAEELKRGGVPFAVIDEHRHTFLQLVLIARRWLDGRSIQVLHSHRYKENLLAGVLSAVGSVPRVVRTQHGMPEPFSGLASVRQCITQTVDRMVARFATDRIVAVTNDLRDQMAGSFSSKKKIVVVENGVSLGDVRSNLTSAEAKIQLGLDFETPVIATACRLVPIKRLDLFVAAASKVIEQCPAARFVIAGDGPDRESIEHSVREANLAHKILLLGHCDRVYDVLRAADVFVLTSDHEGLPMVLLEAMQLGIPIVARRVGGLPEVLGEDCGQFVDDADPGHIGEAIVRLLNDSSSREAMVTRARIRVSTRFNSERSAASLMRVYQSLFS